MKKKIIIKIAFNTFGFTENSYTPEWIADRINIFQNYTLQSLKHQDNQNFLVLVEYKLETKALIFAELSKYPMLPPNIVFVAHSDFYIKKAIKGYQYLYLVRLDSDDVYCTSFISMLHRHKPNGRTEALINQTGYIFDVNNKRLGVYYADSPPFYTLIYRVDEYNKGFRYVLPEGHPDAIKLRHEILNGCNYLVTVHTRNTETVFDNKYYTKGIIDHTNTIDMILKDKFGLRGEISVK